MHYPFSKKEIPRRKILLFINKWQYREERGNYWWSYIETFINWKQLYQLFMGGGMVKLLMEYNVLPNIPFSQVMIIGAIVFIGGGIIIRAIKILGGCLDVRLKVRQIEAEWSTKTAYVNPVGIENIKTIESIAKAVGAKSYYKHLYRKKDDYKELYKKEDKKVSENNKEKL